MKCPKPVTCCTNCGTPGYDIQLANAQCGRMAGKKRCKGTNSSANQENDWAECLGRNVPVGLVMGVANNVRVRAGFSSVGKRSDDIPATGCFLVSLGYS